MVRMLVAVASGYDAHYTLSCEVQSLQNKIELHV